MESSSSSSEFRSSPTVSKEKWAIHARSKLLKGYVLIIAPGRRTASFFKEGRGFEPCPFKIAKALVEMGLVEEAGPHFLGTKYVLSSQAPDPPPVTDRDDDDDEEGGDGEREQSASGMEGLLDDLEAEQSDDGDGDDEEASDAEDGENGDGNEEEDEDDTF